jgi:hypothetical protein
MNARLGSSLFAVAALALGSTTLAPSARADVKATAAKTSTAADRKDVSITIYNQNFGLVREVRSIDLGSGHVALDVADVAATIQPQTVAIRALSGDLHVLEQNYRYDLLSPASLLDKYVGQKIRAYRYNRFSGKEDGFDANLVSAANGSPVLEINGELTFDFPGRLAFPGVPPNLIAKPTLVWVLDAEPQGTGKQDVEITYLAESMTWAADYVLVIDDADTKGDLTGWVTLSNQSGASYTNTKLKLVAGDVNRLKRDEGYDKDQDGVPDADDKKPAFKEEGLFEYHLYTLDRPTDVLEKEQKQVTLLEANGIKVAKKLIFYGEPYGYRSESGEVTENQKVGVYIDLENSEKNGLGMPLPKGVVRVYKSDKSGARQFLGEDQIDHTPRDERVRVKMGEAFDVVGNRRQIAYKALGNCSAESSWEIELRNHKDTAVDVEVWEPIGADSTIVESSQPATKKDAATVTFDVAIPANDKKKVAYRVRAKWC